MAFTTRKYETDEGAIINLRMSEEYAAVAANTEPAGAVTLSIYAKKSKTNREFGLRPRGVRIAVTGEVTVGDSTRNVKVFAFLPILTPTVFDSNAFDPGQTVAIDGVTWTVQSRVQEDF